MRPLFVETLWSEAGEPLDTRRVWPLADFEAKARAVAMSHKTGGYLKTMVNVLFDNGDTVQVRLDLAAGDTHGFRHHVEMYRRFLATDEGRRCYEDNSPMSREFFDAMLAIRFADEQAEEPTSGQLNLFSGQVA